MRLVSGDRPIKSQVEGSNHKILVAGFTDFTPENRMHNNSFRLFMEDVQLALDIVQLHLHLTLDIVQLHLHLTGAQLQYSSVGAPRRDDLHLLSFRNCDAFELILMCERVRRDRII